VAICGSLLRIVLFEMVSSLRDEYCQKGPHLTERLEAMRRRYLAALLCVFVSVACYVEAPSRELAPQPQKKPSPEIVMADRFWFIDTSTTKLSGVDPNHRDLVNVPPGASKTMDFVVSEASGERQVGSDGNTSVRWYTPRFNGTYTLAGPWNIGITARASNASYNGRIRVRLWKLTADGGNVETLIAQGDAATNLTTSDQQFTFSASLSQPITVVENERLVARVYVVPQTGGFGAGTATFTYAISSPTYSAIDLDIVASSSFKGMGSARLYHRRSGTTGIGLFYDMTEALGSVANTNAIVNTVSGGGEIQWTRAGGGTIIEWISARFKYGWQLAAPATVSGMLIAEESGAPANVSARVKIFRRTSVGVETLIASWSQSTELTTNAASATTFSAALESGAPFTFAEDDRMIFRIYIYPAPGQTMGGSRFATLMYDHPSPPASTMTYVDVPAEVTFKAESDPARADIVPSSGALTGVSNGQ
jgi:hypothetical protein